MASKYWIKLYHEILQDPKMGRLPDNVWRRAIEIFLLAGEMDENGKLPKTEEMAWLLRQPNIEIFEAELSHLESLNIITRTPEGWLVTKFAERQEATSVTDRVKEFRKRKRAEQFSSNALEDQVKQDGNENETDDVTKRYTDKDTDKDNSKDLGLPRATKGKKSKIPSNKEMFGVLAHICAINWQICTEEKRGELNQVEKILRVGARASPDDLKEFRQWWDEYDWRGKKRGNGDPPTPSQVRDEWQKFVDWRQGKGEMPVNGMLPTGKTKNDDGSYNV